MRTRTGGFPLGFRRGWSEWQKDLGATLAWAKAEGLEVVDTGSDPADARAVIKAGLRVGTADLADWGGLMAKDPGRRREAVERDAAQAAEMAALGVRSLFCCMLPPDPGLPRRENFGYLVEALGDLAPKLEAAGVALAVEGYPGAGALMCTPESYRAVIQAVGSQAVGINFDPSHLIRMNVDPVRFLGEFAASVVHVHGKDTERFAEAAYEYGTEIGPTLGESRGFGGPTWRYTIPGHGEARWTRLFEILKDAGYAGGVSIELEDDRYNGTEEGDKTGILTGARFLSEC